MSPILVRPVREQLGHDRIIRLLQVKCRRRYEAGINPGTEQNVPVSSGASTLFPDLVLLSQERGRRLKAVVEVETGESVNHLEALAQWAHLSRLRAEFHLYVPSSMVDVARQLCEDNQIHVHEIWSFHTVGDEVRFTLVHRAREVAQSRTRVIAAPARAKAQPARAKAQPARAKARPAARKPPLRVAKSAARAKTTKKTARARTAKKPARARKRK